MISAFQRHTIRLAPSLRTKDTLVARPARGLVVGKQNLVGLQVYSGETRTADLSGLTRIQASVAGYLIDTQDIPNAFDWTLFEDEGGDLLAFRPALFDLPAGRQLLRAAWYDATHALGVEAEEGVGVYSQVERVSSLYNSVVFSFGGAFYSCTVDFDDAGNPYAKLTEVAAPQPTAIAALYFQEASGGSVYATSVALDDAGNPYLSIDTGASLAPVGLVRFRAANGKRFLGYVETDKAGNQRFGLAE